MGAIVAVAWGVLVGISGRVLMAAALEAAESAWPQALKSMVTNRKVIKKVFFTFRCLRPGCPRVYF